MFFWHPASSACLPYIRLRDRRQYIHMKNPDDIINCLLVYPEFSAFSFWNVKDAIRDAGAKATTPPLGLLTVAAIFPQHWNFRLLDLNAHTFSEEEWAWADLIATSGMLPQQEGLLAVIERAKKDGKFVVAGGPDPTSQPHIYRDADALVLNEGEITIPAWLDAWRAGNPRGVFQTAEKPDVSQTPIPRFDLINMKDYYYMGVQYARGCPFNCEFCDIIELYGRKPRHKSPEQFLSELQKLYDLGFRGYIEIVDDNFIGNKRNVKRELLPALIEWQKKHRKPFYFGTEASMNLGDDVPLLELMREAQFKSVFMGIETPDPELLEMTQKSQNTVRPITERVHKVYEHGIFVSGGFIMGFDNEKKNMDKSMIACIEDAGICMAMIGLLVALPKTQLTRRLLQEKRLIDMQGNLMTQAAMDTTKIRRDMKSGVVDQTLAGLNFITTRDRCEILAEYGNTVRTVYETRSYFDRALRTARMMRYRKPRLHHPWELKRNLRSMIVMSWRMTLNKKTRWLYWRNFFGGAMLGLYRFEIVMTLMSIYQHFAKQSAYLLGVLDSQMEFQSTLPQKTDRPISKTATGETNKAV
jgi:radical SAM superfamily enzyme YgiQ (UPF0313 family)